MGTRRDEEDNRKKSVPVCADPAPYLSFRCIAFRCQMKIVRDQTSAFAALRYASENPEMDADGKEIQHKIGSYRDITVVQDDSLVEVIRVTLGWGAVCNRKHVGDEVSCPHCGEQCKVSTIAHCSALIER